MISFDTIIEIILALRLGGGLATVGVIAFLSSAGAGLRPSAIENDARHLSEKGFDKRQHWLCVGCRPDFQCDKPGLLTRSY